MELHSLIRPVTSALDVSDKATRRALSTFSILIYVFLYTPVLVVVLLSFTPRSVPTFPIPGFSLRWYQRLIPPGHDEAIIDGLIMSLKLGITSAIGAGIIGTLAGISLGRLDSEGRLFNADVLNTIFLAPLVIPWVVTGIAILVLYSILGISGTFMSLVLGHILIALPFVVIIVSAQMYGLDHSLEEAARNLGASRLRTFYEVTLPLIAPGIIAGMLFAFTISFDNFTQTFFWTNASTQTLPVVIYSKIRFGLDPTVNSIGTIIIIFSVTIALIAERISSRILQ